MEKALCSRRYGGNKFWVNWRVGVSEGGHAVGEVLILRTRSERENRRDSTCEIFCIRPGENQSLFGSKQYGATSSTLQSEISGWIVISAGKHMGCQYFLIRCEILDPGKEMAILYETAAAMFA